MPRNIANTRTGIRALNTTVSEADGNLRVTLYSTLVFEQMPNGNIWLNSGGYNTATTCSRINQAFNYLNLPWAIGRSKGQLELFNRETRAKHRFDREARILANGDVECK